ncbi:MAG: hypothetical protein MI922_10165 [Bacteroidales bacterium]|nr:hypothetical protein [Bacteroidales bacterium]
MISKYKNAQLVFIDGKQPVKIKRVLRKENRYEYELKESGEIIPENRLSLVKQ